MLRPEIHESLLLLLIDTSSCSYVQDKISTVCCGKCEPLQNEDDAESNRFKDLDEMDGPDGLRTSN